MSSLSRTGLTPGCSDSPMVDFDANGQSMFDTNFSPGNIFSPNVKYERTSSSDNIEMLAGGPASPIVSSDSSSPHNLQKMISPRAMDSLTVLADSCIASVEKSRRGIKRESNYQSEYEDHHLNQAELSNIMKSDDSPDSILSTKNGNNSLADVSFSSFAELSMLQDSPDALNDSFVSTRKESVPRIPKSAIKSNVNVIHWSSSMEHQSAGQSNAKLNSSFKRKRNDISTEEIEKAEEAEISLRKVLNEQFSPSKHSATRSANIFTNHIGM